MNIGKVYIFDMDHTLINTDSDVAWKDYAVKHGLAPADAIAQADKFYEDYKAGTLNFEEFIAFQHQEFIGKTVAEMSMHTEQLYQEFIAPYLYPKAIELINELHANNIPVAVLSSTCNIIVGAIAKRFGIENVIGTQLEVIDGVFTGKIVGEYGSCEGKIGPAKRFAEAHGATLADVVYYGDSINDINVLEVVGHPMATNPSDYLKDIAKTRNWQIVNF